MPRYASLSESLRVSFTEDVKTAWQGNRGAKGPGSSVRQIVDTSLRNSKDQLFMLRVRGLMKRIGLHFLRNNWTEFSGNTIHFLSAIRFPVGTLIGTVVHARSIQQSTS